MMEATKVHEAAQYLCNPNTPNSLYVIIGGQKRRLFFNPQDCVFGIIAKGKRKSGYIFNEWDDIEKILYPKSVDPVEVNRKMVAKYQRLASKATFKNKWLEAIANADQDKSLYENNITTGVSIDGQCILLSTIEKYCGSHEIEMFRNAVRNGEKFHTPRFDFRGYDGTLWVNVSEEGYVTAGFCKEYRNCGNGYYYLLINDETMIGYDID